MKKNLGSLFQIIGGGRDVNFKKIPLITSHLSSAKIWYYDSETTNLNPFMHNVKWPRILLKPCGVHTARFLKYVWPFYNIMYERIKQQCLRLKNM